MINRLIFPLLSVWIIAVYIHLVLCLHIMGIVASKIIASFLFIPVIFLEILFSIIYYPDQIKKFSDIKRKWLFLLACRLLFWLIFFIIWVLFITYLSKNTQILAWVAPQFYLLFYLVFRGESWITLIASAIWLVIYYYYTVKGNRVRIFTTMILPMILFASLFIHLYFFGGIGGLYESGVFAQEGVERFFQIKNIDSHIVPQHPRGIYFDKNENALFIMFGQTFTPSLKPYPTIVRKDLSSNSTHFFLSRNIRRIHIDGTSRHIFVAPWYQQVFYVLSKKDLSIIGNNPNQTEGLLRTWEPMDIFKDRLTNRVYIGNGVEQAFISYDLDTGRIARILHLYNQGLVDKGGPVGNILQSKKDGMIYFTSGPGMNLFEVDPESLNITKQKSFFDITASALAIDEEGGMLYYQNGCFNALYEIDIESFEVKRTLRGEGHARRILLDKRRNCIYVLGYFSGTVFPIDLTTGKRLWTVRVGGLPHGIDLSDNTLWINSMSGVMKLDLETIWKRFEDERSQS